MEKYRITSETTNQTSNGNKTTFYIERKRWYGWRKIKIKEDVKKTTLTFNAYEEAEKHMIDNYFGHGWFYKPYTNEYHYQDYTYWV